MLESLKNTGGIKSSICNMISANAGVSLSADPRLLSPSILNHLVAQKNTHGFKPLRREKEARGGCEQDKKTERKKTLQNESYARITVGGRKGKTDSYYGLNALLTFDLCSNTSLHNRTTVETQSERERLQSGE